MRFTLAAIGLVAATLTFAAPAAAAPSPEPAPAEQAGAPSPVPSVRSRAATPAPVPRERGDSRPVPDGAPQTGGGVPAALPLGGVLLVAGAATGFVALRRRGAA
ncbi:hypothetical protein [Herbidospora yilanensis]|uniref:hypothetical protein n=1 Tax=Herbidospora yilanensis TaxID=354426 RepID=UPI000782654B|nr:hypothetical protein [Herbidospora yilanensis]